MSGATSSQPRGNSPSSFDQSQCLLSSFQFPTINLDFLIRLARQPPPTSYHHVIFYVTPVSQSGRCLLTIKVSPTTTGNIHYSFRDGGTLRVPCPIKSSTVIHSDEGERILRKDLAGVSSLRSGLGPVKSRQDDLKYRKIREETNGMNFNNFFFRTSDCIENDTTMEDDSFRQESPVNTSRETFFFPEFDLNKFSSLKSFLECFDKQCLEYQKRRAMEEAKYS
ncbi:hypothetical protein TNCV_2343851 [Trichonephila clavipes]|nr:hypothetical protein TNCV_2343851 [Trichonephila clavipes]